MYTEEHKHYLDADSFADAIGVVASFVDGSKTQSLRLERRPGSTTRYLLHVVELVEAEPKARKYSERERLSYELNALGEERRKLEDRLTAVKARQCEILDRLAELDENFADWLGEAYPHKP